MTMDETSNYSNYAGDDEIFKDDDHQDPNKLSKESPPYEFTPSLSKPDLYGDRQSFDHKLYDSDGDDDEEELAYKAILDDLIVQRLTPSQAAKAMDEWVTSEANRKYALANIELPPSCSKWSQMPTIHHVTEVADYDDRVHGVTCLVC